MLPARELQLPKKAYDELYQVLVNEIGDESLSKLSKDEINHIGVVMLSLACLHLKIHLREKGLIDL